MVSALATHDGKYDVETDTPGKERFSTPCSEEEEFDSKLASVGGFSRYIQDTLLVYFTFTVSLRIRLSYSECALYVFSKKQT